MEIFAASWVLPISAPPIHGGAIAVEEGRVVAVGTVEQLRKEFSAPISDYHGCVLMPGLINAHCHLELTHFPAWKIRKGLDYAPRTYVDWIIQVIKIKRALGLNELELSLREGVRISLESGTTAVGDILSDLRLLPLYRSVPLAGRIYLELIGYDPQRTVEHLRRVAGALEAPLPEPLLPALSPHAPHTVSRFLFQEIAALAEAKSLPLMVHLSESPDEGAFMHDSTGSIAEDLFPFVGWDGYLPSPRRITPAQFLEEVGILNKNVAAVHCVHINASDVRLLEKHNVAVVLCPRSNERLGVGKPPLQLLRKSGICLALGTDSLASNDSLYLWDEMRYLRRHFPGIFSPEEVLRMVTLDAARTLRISDRLGSLENRKSADFIMLQCPSGYGDDIAEALIEEGQVEQVFLRGRPVAM